MSDNRKVNFQYVYDKEYCPTYVNGAVGGVTPNGDIITNFFFDSMPIPEKIVNQINPDGSLGGVIAVEPENLDSTIIRHVCSGIVMNEENAKAIHAWLGNQISELENRKAYNATTCERN